MFKKKKESATESGKKALATPASRKAVKGVATKKDPERDPIAKKKKAKGK